MGGWAGSVPSPTEHAIQAIRDDERTKTMALLNSFLETLPNGHREVAGVIRAIEVIRHYGAE